MAPAPTVRRPLWWLLSATVLLSVAAIVWPAPDPVGVVPSVQVTAGARAPSMATSATEVSRVQALLAHLPRPPLDAAAADPFAAWSPPVKHQPQAPPPSPIFIQPTPTEPVTPPLLYRFFGQMVGPEGAMRTYLAKGDTVAVVQVGTTLDDGYIVRSIGPESIELLYPPTQKLTVLPVTPPPK